MQRHINTAVVKTGLRNDKGKCFNATFTTGLLPYRRKVIKPYKKHPLILNEARSISSREKTQDAVYMEVSRPPDLTSSS